MPPSTSSRRAYSVDSGTMNRSPLPSPIVLCDTPSLSPKSVDSSRILQACLLAKQARGNSVRTPKKGRSLDEKRNTGPMVEDTGKLAEQRAWTRRGAISDPGIEARRGAICYSEVEEPRQLGNMTIRSSQQVQESLMLQLGGTGDHAQELP